MSTSELINKFVEQLRTEHCGACHVGKTIATLALANSSTYWRDCKGTPIGGKSHVRGTRPAHGDVAIERWYLKKVKDANAEEIKAVVALHAERA